MSLTDKLQQSLLESVASLPKRGRLWVGLSGGLDSMVLLHVLHAVKDLIPQSIGAIHVNHQLSPWADTWEAYVRKVTSKLNIELVAERVKVLPQTGESLEALARSARYEAFKCHVKANDALLTAHHANDQCETMLHHLFCGSGIKGLASMRQISRLLQIAHVRPFLNIEQAVLESYAASHGLIWVEDESNHDTRFRRNFIRHDVIPMIEREYPGIKKTLLRVIQHAATADTLLDDLAEIDYHQAKTEVSTVLDISNARTLSDARLANLLRFWFRQQQVSLPSERKLASIIKNVIRSGVDANPLEIWQQVSIRRYRTELHLLKAALPETSAFCFIWDPMMPLKLPEGLGELHVLSSTKTTHHSPFTVRFRQTGEKLIANDTMGPQSVKKIMQNLSIPPWQRSLIPLIFSKSGELLAIADIKQSMTLNQLFGDDACIEWRYSNYFKNI